MKNSYYRIIYRIIIIIILILFLNFFKVFTLREGMEKNDAQLWKNNHHNIILLKKNLDSLESLEYIRKNNPKLLGDRADDTSLTIEDVVKYFKSGIKDNEMMLAEIAERAENAIPKEENVNISGI